MLSLSRSVARLLSSAAATPAASCRPACAVRCARIVSLMPIAAPRFFSTAAETEAQSTQVESSIPDPKVVVPGEDVNIRCQDCGTDFLFCTSEQQFYAERGFRQPIRCRPCREARKRERLQSGVRRPRFQNRSNNYNNQAGEGGHSSS